MILPLLCLALLHTAPLPQEPAVDPLSCVPAEALMFLKVEQLDALRADGRENAWYRMFLDEDFDPAWEVLQRSEGWQEAFEGGESAVDPSEVLASIHGSITIFVDHFTPEQEDDFAGGLVIDPGQDRAEFERLIDTLIAAKHDDFVYSYESYEGLELMLMEDADSSGAPEGSSLFIETDTLYFLLFGTSSEELLESARATVDMFQGQGGGPALADSPLLAEARSGETSPGRIELFLNTHTLIDMVPEEELGDEDTQLIFEALGIPQMTWVHAWMDLGQGEQSDFELSVRLPDEGFLLDWANFFKPVPQYLAGLVPEDATTIGLVGYDMWGLYQSVWDLVEEVFPDEYEEARTQFEVFGQSIGGVDVEQDLLAQLTGDTASFSAPVPEAEWLAAQSELIPLGPGEVPQDLLFGDAFMLSLEDAELVALTIEDLMEFAGLMGFFDPMAIESEDFQGLEVQSLELPTGGTASWCFDKDLFAFSLYPTALRAVLRLRGAEGAGSARENKDLAPHLAAEADAGYLVLADSKTAVKLALESLGLLQTFFPGLGDDVWGDMGHDNSAEPDEFDWNFSGVPIPEPAVADRYLSGTIIMTAQVEGRAFKLRYATR